MKIKLNEIPEMGQNYILNRKTAELNTSLKDIIGDKPYNIDMTIRPLNTKDFTINGVLDTAKIEVCSRCGEDFEFKLSKRLNEILIPKYPEDRMDKSSKIRINAAATESEVSVLEYSQMQFDLAEYIHEAIALDIPYISHCLNCKTNNNDKTFSYDENMGEDVKPNPFATLKGLKLN
jgi:uncharacterized metal-binding protein YceD (DUF177 family)